MNCADRIRLSGREWQEVRSEPNRFAVAPGHVASDLEAVVKKYPHFWLVEKQGGQGKRPRSWRNGLDQRDTARAMSQENVEVVPRGFEVWNRGTWTRSAS